jgi:hypothetical protein
MVTVPPKVAELDVMFAEVGEVTVGTTEPEPLPVTGTLMLLAPPPPTTIFPLYEATVVGENLTKMSCE